MHGEFWKKLVVNAQERDLFSTGNVLRMLRQPSSDFPAKAPIAVTKQEMALTKVDGANGSGTAGAETTDDGLVYKKVSQNVAPELANGQGGRFKRVSEIDMDQSQRRNMTTGSHRKAESPMENGKVMARNDVKTAASSIDKVKTESMKGDIKAEGKGRIKVEADNRVKAEGSVKVKREDKPKTIATEDKSTVLKSAKRNDDSDNPTATPPPHAKVKTHDIVPRRSETPASVSGSESKPAVVAATGQRPVPKPAAPPSVARKRKPADPFMPKAKMAKR